MDSLKGDYILTERGTLGASFSVAAIGRVTFDGMGGAAGWRTIHGIDSPELVQSCSGTYTVDADGNGTLTLSHTLPIPVPEDQEPLTQDSVYRFLVTGGSELRAIRTNAGAVVSTVLSRTTSAAMSSLKGTYTFSEEGVVSSGAGLAGLGGITFSEDGTATGWETAQIGNQGLATTFTGEYTFDSNGVGTLKLVHVLPTAIPLGDGEEAPTANAEYRFVAVSGAGGATEVRAVRAEARMAISTSIRPR